MKRKNIRRKIFYFIQIIIFITLSVLTVFGTLRISKDDILKKVDYNETGIINSSICLNDSIMQNGNKCMPGNSQNVASLIDKIDLNYIYALNLSEKGKYEYNYTITAYTIIEEKGNKDVVLFHKDEILDSNNTVSTNHENLEINKSFKIDYQKYNKLIEDFKKSYELDINAYMKVEMNVNMIATVEDMPQKIQRSFTSNSIIPLGKQTIELSFDKDDHKYDGKLVKLKEKTNTYDSIALFNDIVYKLDILYVLFVFFFFIKIRPKKRKFDKHIEKILKAYDKDIVNVHEIPNFEKENVYKIDEIKELVDAKNALNRPIMHYETHNYAIFFITTQEDIYYYELKAKDM